MIFTVFSLFTAIIWVSVFAKIISILRKNMLLYKFFSIYPLLLILFACILRLFFSIELPFTKTINSKIFLPFFQALISAPLFLIGGFQITTFFFIAVVWVTFAAIRLVKSLISYFQLKRLLNFLPETKDNRFYQIIEKADTAKRFSNVKIIVHAAVEAPAIIGFMKPIIIFPDINFTDTELLGIFVHELSHYHYGHIYFKLITRIIGSFFWWNPFFKNLSIELAHALELHADKRVCETLTKEQQYSYLKGINKVIYNLHRAPHLHELSGGLVEETNSEKLKQRFLMIIENNYQRKKSYDIIIIPLICMIFILSYTFVLEPYSEPASEDYGNMDDVSTYPYLIKTDSGYEFYDADDNFIADIVIITEELNHFNWKTFTLNKNVGIINKTKRMENFLEN